MPVKNETSTRLIDEIRMISPWFYVLASIGFAMPFAAMAFVFATKAKTPPMPVPVMVPVGLLAAAVMACYILLIGYVNFDAGRRGMSRLAWTLLAIFIPHALGIVLYFVLRSPRRLNCPQCGMVVEPGFGFCPGCRRRLNAVCPKCQRGVSASDKFCPYCGGELGVGTGATPALAQS
jgi:hypothetical protein